MGTTSLGHRDHYDQGPFSPLLVTVVTVTRQCLSIPQTQTSWQSALPQVLAIVTPVRGRRRELDSMAAGSMKLA